MKLLNKISTLMLAVVLAVSFTACDDRVNDNMNDVKTSLEQEISDLQNKVNQLESDLAAINSCTCTPHPNVDSIVAAELLNFYTNTIRVKIDSLGSEINDVKSDVAQNKLDIAALATRVGTLETSVATNTAAILTLTNQMTTLIADTAVVHTQIRTLQTDVQDLQNRMTIVEQTATQALANASAALTLAKADSAEIEALKLHMQQHCDSLTLLAAQIATIDSLAQAYLDSALQYTDEAISAAVDTLQIQIDNNTASILTLQSDLADEIQARQDDFNLLNSRIDTLTNRIDTIETKLDELTGRVDVLEDRFNRAIYSIELNGTTNPVFGYMALPFDVTSNMLLAYYGTNSLPIEFPTANNSLLVNGSAQLSAAEAARLNIGQFTKAGGSVLVGENAGAGKIYFFINPGEVDINETYQFSLVNSIGEACPIELDTVVPSEEVLYAGVNRAPGKEKSPYSFYEAPALLPEDNCEEANFNLNTEAIKQNAKEFYHLLKREPNNASFTSLAASLLGVLSRPAQLYALKVEWPDTLGEMHSCKSAAKITANSIKPLSYAALQDVNFPNFPLLRPFDELPNYQINVGDLDFSLNVGTANITLNAIDFSSLSDVNISINVPNGFDPATGHATGDTVVTVPLDDLENWLNTNFNAGIAEWEASVNNEVNSLISQINNQVSNQVNGMLSPIQGVIDQANGMITNLIGKGNTAISYYNRFVTKANAAITRINNKLTSPNQFLQVTMLYEGNGEFHFLSNSRVAPSVFNCSGSTGAIVLYPTSFNAEILVPAYKKFVAVTNVWDNTTGAEVASKVATTNNNANFNTVLEGNRYGVAFQAEKGYTYEIFYSALDFSGKISQRKYYVTVK
ncbi:MAG: hypothetical protein ACI4AW_03835 [Paludibacteraceae bacterium]